MNCYIYTPGQDVSGQSERIQLIILIVLIIIQEIEASKRKARLSFWKEHSGIISISALRIKIARRQWD